MADRNDIAARLRDRIRAGEYRLGSKLPSTRQIADELGGSRATASAALHLLADEGFVILKDRSTAVVGAPEEQSGTQENLLADVGAELLAARDDLTHMQQQLSHVIDRLANTLDRLSTNATTGKVRGGP